MSKREQIPVEAFYIRADFLLQLLDTEKDKNKLLLSENRSLKRKLKRLDKSLRKNVT